MLKSLTKFDQLRKAVKYYNGTLMPKLTLRPGL